MTTTTTTIIDRLETSTVTACEPDRDCDLCPRLKSFIDDWRAKEPDWHNAPVPTWLPPDGRKSVELLIVGLAPGLRGANRTGRPFTGDYAGDLLYATLKKFDLAVGDYGAAPLDGLELSRTAITNAVRCVPPQNKPVGAEINTCRDFLTNTIESFENLKVIFSLGKISHDSVVRTLGGRVAGTLFGHGSVHTINGHTLISSYHCSRYNTNTGRLTEPMFESVFETISSHLR
ncbi:MAG: uracil-DNA glycosylase [Pseudomonadota bacterium]